jgi:GT2 family glycosyltransferase
MTPGDVVIEGPPTEGVRLSIVIPTIPRRKHYMRRCLEALALCDDRELAEVLVISEEAGDLRAMIEEWNANVCTRLVQGHPAAAPKRNAGACAARGDIIAFLDDDTEPEPGYVTGMLATFDAGAIAVGGRIVPDFESEIPGHLRGQPFMIRGFNILDGKQRDDFFIGANIAFKREVFQQVGLFSPDFGRMGNRYPHGDESEFVRRVQARFDVTYAPDAGVKHAIQPHRMSREYMRTRSWRSGRTRAAIDDLHRSDFSRHLVSVAVFLPVLVCLFLARPLDLGRRLRMINASGYTLEGFKLLLTSAGRRASSAPRLP